MSDRLIQYHLKPGTLVLIAGGISGVIVKNYNVAFVHFFNSNNFVLCQTI